MEEKSKLRIMHIADVHLDSPFSRLGAEQAEIRRREQRGVFTSMMMYAKSRKTDIVLIAGDLFDVGYASEQTLDIITREFEKAPECRFVISAGNHDPYSARSAYKLRKFPDNVYIFPSPELSKFSFDDIGVDVYGWSFTSDTLDGNPLAGKTAQRNGNIPLLCVHCDTSSASSKYAPVNEGDIERFGAVYSALGHIHRGEGIKKFSSGAAYGYSGCPSGRSFDECGVGGAYMADIELTREGRPLVNVSFEPFSVSTYESEQIDMTGVMSLEEARARVGAFIKDGEYGAQTSLRLTLRGLTGTDTGRLDGFSAEEFGLFSLEIRDETSPTYDCSRFMTDMTVRGAFYRVLAPMLESEDENERRIAAEALRVGFAALDGSDVTAI
jgi:DNA repair exonuclease SbcCD nuclease subunit